MSSRAAGWLSLRSRIACSEVAATPVLLIYYTRKSRNLLWLISLARFAHQATCFPKWSSGPLQHYREPGNCFPHKWPAPRAANPNLCCRPHLKGPFATLVNGALGKLYNQWPIPGAPGTAFRQSQQCLSSGMKWSVYIQASLKHTCANSVTHSVTRTVSHAECHAFIHTHKTRMHHPQTTLRFCSAKRVPWSRTFVGGPGGQNLARQLQNTKTPSIEALSQFLSEMSGTSARSPRNSLKCDFPWEI